MPNSDYESLELLLTNKNDDYKNQLEPDLNRWPRVRAHTSSSNKESFTYGFFMGKISGFMNTELGGEFRINNLYHSIESKMIKSFLVLKGECDYRVFSLIYSGEGNGILCKEEWSKISGFEKERDIEFPENIVIYIKEISIDRNLNGINKNFQVSVTSRQLTSSSLRNCKGEELDFIQVSKYSDNELLEDKINKLCCNDDTKAIKEKFMEIMRKFYEDYIHDYESIIKEKNFSYKEYFAKSELFRCQREAVQHGYMIGRFYNYRYRFNISILPELSSGNGFVDTVMVVRGKENSLISIPIIIEHKQGDRAEGSIDKALEEAKSYSLGFQPAGVPFLTSSKSRIYVGINLDRNPFYGIDSLSTELLGLSFIENYFNEVPEDMESLNKMTEEIKEELKKIKNTLTCVNKKAENECSLNNKMNNFFNTFYGFASLSHQYNIRMNSPELINNLFACRVSDSNCKPEDSGLFHCLSQAGIVLVEGSTDPKSMVIFNFYPYKEKRGTLPLNEIKGMMGDINKLTNILENKINVSALITDKEGSIIKTDRYSGFDDYKDNHDKLLDKCEFVEIPYPKALIDEFIEAICSLPNPLNDANRIFKKFNDFFKRIPEVFNSDYFYSGDEKKFEMILFGLLLGCKSLIDEEGTIECKNKMEINDVEALTQYQMGYNDGTIDLLIKLGSNDKPMGIELKRDKGRSQESECKNSLEKYNKGNAYRELTDNRKMMLIGYILDDRNKAVKPCKANSEEGGPLENRRANIGMLGNVSLDMLDHPSIPEVIHLRYHREVTADTVTSGAQRPSFYPATVIKNLFSAISPWFYSGSEILSSWWSSSTLDTREGLYNSSSNVHTEEQTFNGSLIEVGDQWLSQGNVQGSLQLLDWLVRRYTGHKFPQPVVTYTPSWEVSSAQAGEFVDDFHKNLQRAILASGVKPATVLQQLDEVTLRNQVAQNLYAGKPLKELEKILKSTIDRVHQTICQRATCKQADKFIDCFNRHHQNHEVDIRRLKQQCAGITESNLTLAAPSVLCREGLSPTPWLTTRWHHWLFGGGTL